MDAADAIRVLIADDHDSIRSGLRAILSVDPGIVVVGEAVDGPDAIALALRLRPDVVILDNRMPGLDGVEVARRIGARGAGRPAIVYFSTEIVPGHALQPGDRALMKDASAADIVRTVVEAGRRIRRA